MEAVTVILVTYAHQVLELSCPTRKFSTKGYISFKHNTLIVSLTYFQREFISEEMFIVSTLFIFQVCMFSQWEIGCNFPALFGCIALIVLLAVPKLQPANGVEFR